MSYKTSYLSYIQTYLVEYYSYFRVNNIGEDMLELKDVSLSSGGKLIFNNLSFIVNDGDTLRLTGSNVSGKTALLHAILGFQPIDDGYITVDGEVINHDSAETLRSMMAYLPHDLALDAYENVSDLIENLATLRSNRTLEYSKQALFNVWEKVGLSSTLYGKNLKGVGITLIRVIILTVIMVLKKPVVLVDTPVSDKETSIISLIARQGAAVVVADSHENARPGDLQINLNS